MTEETSPNTSQAASWFSDINLKTALIVAGLSSLFGIGGGAGIVASKGVQAAGMNQDQADVRYLSKDEAARFRLTSDKQLEDLKSEIKADIEKTLKKETFDAYHRSDEMRMERIEKLLIQNLEK